MKTETHVNTQLIRRMGNYYLGDIKGTNCNKITKGQVLGWILHQDNAQTQNNEKIILISRPIPSFIVHILQFLLCFNNVMCIIGAWKI